MDVFYCLAGSPEYLGYYNRTCNTGTSTGEGWGVKRVGPYLRNGSAQNWRDFVISVLNKTENGHVLATIQTYYPTVDAQPR